MATKDRFYVQTFNALLIHFLLHLTLSVAIFSTPIEKSIDTLIVVGELPSIRTFDEPSKESHSLGLSHEENRIQN